MDVTWVIAAARDNSESDTQGERSVNYRGLCIPQTA